MANRKSFRLDHVPQFLLDTDTVKLMEQHFLVEKTALMY